MRDRWLDIRRHHLSKLDEALKNGLVDEGVISILNAINRFEEYVTRSSCYGRVSFTQEKGLIKKGRGKILYKRHGPIDMETIKKIIRKVDGGVLWMNIEGTIIHVASKTIEDALKLLDIAVEAGYKESSLYSMSTRGVTVEILFSEKYSIPLYTRENGFLISTVEVQSIIEYIDERFREIEKAKHRLINLLAEYKGYENTYC